ncbi:hypothetical protein DSO57_1000571 [Entomophthora muscae]|uniref:Uncharacterized protein n=1 Tax=Entomophthora muscae TaxID=34485 RepID=A0ACC2SBR3_9FUNG|nr:hypothetical protein DSO57_1000571 [Entomophthora muscae]
MELLISKDKGTSLGEPIAYLSLDLLEPSPVDLNSRGKDSAKDDDVLHEVEIVELHTFQRPPLSLPKPLPPENPGTVKSFSYSCHRPVKAQGGNSHLSVPALNQLRRLLQKTPEATLSEDNSQAGINQASFQDLPEISQLMRDDWRSLNIQCYWTLNLNVACLIILAAYETSIGERFQTLSQFTETMEHSLCSYITQVMYHTGPSLENSLVLYGEILGHHSASCLEPWICPGLVMPGPEELQVLLSNLSPVTLTVQKKSAFGIYQIERTCQHAPSFTLCWT